MYGQIFVHLPPHMWTNLSYVDAGHQKQCTTGQTYLYLPGHQEKQDTHFQIFATLFASKIQLCKLIYYHIIRCEKVFNARFFLLFSSSKL